MGQPKEKKKNCKKKKSMSLTNKAKEKEKTKNSKTAQFLLCNWLLVVERNPNRLDLM